MFKPTPLTLVLLKFAFKRIGLLKGIAVAACFSLVITLIYLCSTLVPTVAAATQSTINFQARLQSATGAIAPDGLYNVQFKLYDATTGGTNLWTESYTYNGGAPDQRVRVQNGYLSVSLGSQTAFPTTINWDQQLYLTMNIGGSTTTVSYDGEMNPRLTLTAVPYAFRAGQLAANNGTYASTLTLASPTSGNQNFVIPDQGAAGTYNLLTSAAANGSYIQNGTGVQTGANFNVGGNGVVGGYLQAPTLYATNLDTANTGGTLILGASNATGGIALGQNVSLVSGKSLTLTNGNISQTSSITGSTAGISSTVNSSGVNVTASAISGTLNDTATSASANALKYAGTLTLNKTGSAADTGFNTGALYIQSNINAGSTANVWNIESRVQVAAGASVTNAYDFVADAQYGTTGSVGTRAGLNVRDWNKGASQTLNTQYGVLINNLTSGTNNYSIYTGTAQSYFGGAVTAQGALTANNGTTVTNGASISGGLNNNSGNITNAGNISGAGTYAGTGNITSTGGVISMQGTGTNLINGSLNVGTGAGNGAVNLNVNGAIQQTGMGTNNTGSANAGQWIQLGSCTINSRYNACVSTISIIGGNDGNAADNTQATVSWRVKQQNGNADNTIGSQAPFVNVTLNNTAQVITKNDIVAVTTTNSATQTVVQLWARITPTFEQWYYTPTQTAPQGVNSIVAWTPYSAFQAALPTGTQTVAVYGDSYVNNLTVSGVASLANGLNLNNSGITNTGAIGGVTTINGAGNVTIQAGGANALTLDTTGAGTLNFGTTNAATVNIGAVGTTATATTVNIGTTTGAAQNIDIGGTGVSGTSANSNTIVTVQGGGTVMNVASSGVMVRTYNNSTTALQIQNTSGNTVMAVDTGGGKLVLGKASTLSGAMVFNNAAGANTVTLQAPATNPASSFVLTLPSALGAAGSCLKQNDASGTLAFGVCGTGNSTTLQDVYNSSGTTSPQIQLNTTNGGLKIRDASGGVTGNLFQLQNSAGTATFFAVSSTAMTLQNSQGGTAMIMDTSAGHLKIYEPGSSPSRYADIYYDATNGEAVYSSSSGATRIGSGTGNVAIQLTNASDVLLFNKTATLGGAYTSNDFTITRNLSAGSNAVGGSVLKVTSTSSGTNLSSNLLWLDQNNTSDTGNLIQATSAGTNALFTVTASGSVTIAAGQSFQSAGSMNLQAAGTGLPVKVGGGDVSIDDSPSLLVLDNKASATDPTGINGAMYYNAGLGAFRCFENGAWYNCISRHIVTMGSDVTTPTNTPNTFYNVNGLSFNVTAGQTYRFHALVAFDASATGAGSRFAINGPATSYLAYTASYPNTSSGSAVSYAASYDALVGSTNTVLTSGNTAVIDGIITPSSSGTVTLRFATRVTNNSITAKAGSTLEWW